MPENQGTKEKPFNQGPWQNVYECHWGGCYVHIKGSCRSTANGTPGVPTFTVNLPIASRVGAKVTKNEIRERPAYDNPVSNYHYFEYAWFPGEYTAQDWIDAQVAQDVANHGPNGTYVGYGVYLDFHDPNFPEMYDIYRLEVNFVDHIPASNTREYVWEAAYKVPSKETQFTISASIQGKVNKFEIVLEGVNGIKKPESFDQFVAAVEEHGGYDSVDRGNAYEPKTWECASWVERDPDAGSGEKKSWLEVDVSEDDSGTAA